MCGFFLLLGELSWGRFIAIDFTTIQKNFTCVSNFDNFEGPRRRLGQVHVKPITSDVSLFDYVLELCVFFFIIILLHSFLWILNFYCRAKCVLLYVACTVFQWLLQLNRHYHLGLSLQVIVWCVQTRKTLTMCINRNALDEKRRLMTVNERGKTFMAFMSNSTIYVHNLIYTFIYFSSVTVCSRKCTTTSSSTSTSSSSSSSRTSVINADG